MTGMYGSLAVERAVGDRGQHKMRGIIRLGPSAGGIVRVIQSVNTR